MTEKAKTRGEWIYRGFVLTLLGVLVTQFASFTPTAYDAIKNRTFDTPGQKSDVLRLLDQKAIVTESDKAAYDEHIYNTDRHMSAEEKEQLIIIRENQKRIGQDLQEIKNLLRSANQ